MASSYVEFDGEGFWAGDTSLEGWIGLMVREIDRTPGKEPWLDALRADWHRLTMMGACGVLSANLDEHLDSPAKERVIVELCHRLLNWLEDHRSIKREDVADVQTADDMGWNDSSHWISFGRAFMALVSHQFHNPFPHGVKGDPQKFIWVAGFNDLSEIPKA